MKATKLFIGTFITLLIVLGAVLGILSLWGIHIVDLKFILKIIISAGIAGVALVLLWFVSTLFFKKGI